MSNYPQPPVKAGHTEPAPRRIRAYLNGQVVVDTTAAVYVWENAMFPQYYIPAGDIEADLIPKDATVESPAVSLDGHVRLSWNALDAWFEEDEQVFVHPRSPYTRVDAIRSTRRVHADLDGVTLAKSASTVMVFETGLPTRFYFNRTQVNFEYLTATDKVTSCPYKGTTSGYWTVNTGKAEYEDLAWSYSFPSREVLPITGLIAFYNERIDITVDGEPQARPKTSFS